MVTLNDYWSNTSNVVISWWVLSTYLQTNQISEKNAFCLCAPEGGGLGGEYTDQIIQQREHFPLL